VGTLRQGEPTLDFRNIPNAEWWNRNRFAPREEQPEGPRRGSVLRCLAPYLLAAAIVGLPLAFPAQYLLWLGVNTALALATGCLLAYSGE
jgi:hypothetical protein